MFGSGLPKKNTARLLGFLFLPLLFCSVALATNPWVNSFTPVRTLYVSPTGSGTGTQANPMSLSNAINTSLPGDLYWLMPGTYNGQYTINRAGTNINPIVFRAQPGLAVILNGRIDVTGAYNWVWGLEIKDPNGVGTTAGLDMHAPGVHAINNLIHDIKANIGIGAWNNGPGQVVYGNVVYKQISNGINPHNIYAQNDVNVNGTKYIVGNMFLDAWDATSSTYNVHAYTTGGAITGFDFENNILRKGRFLIGGVNLPSDQSTVQNNYYYNAPVVFGWQRPSQVQFLNNYLGRSMLTVLWFWGAGEVQYPQPQNNIFAGNTMLFPSGPHVDFRTSAYLPGGRCEGCPAIRPSDQFNNNTYSAPFVANFFANNNDQGDVNLTTWRNISAAAGKGFDANSTEVSGTPANKIVVLPNEYETGRGHVAIFNWSLSSTVNVDLSSIVSSGSAFQVLDPRNMGTPVLTGVYSGPVNIPTGGSEFVAFLVQAGSAPPPPPPPPPPNQYSVYLEAESQLLAEPVKSKKSPDASNQKFIYFTDAEQGTTTISFWVPQGATYYVWARVLAPNPAQDSFHVSVDGGVEDTFDVAQNKWSDLWQWTKLNGRGSSGVPLSINPRTFSLGAGNHTIVFRGAEAQTDLDMIAVTSDSTFVPTCNTVNFKVKSKKIQPSSAKIKWNTSMMTHTQLEWGTTPLYGNMTQTDPSYVDEHVVDLASLVPGITYHYRVRSTDTSNHTWVSPDFTFTTLMP
jgi:hypothetical protein